MTNFPTFKSHLEASCFNCDGDFADVGAESGYAAGHGQFLQHCEKCGMSTWYDLKEEQPLTHEEYLKQMRLARKWDEEDERRREQERVTTHRRWED